MSFYLLCLGFCPCAPGSVSLSLLADGPGDAGGLYSGDSCAGQPVDRLLGHGHSGRFPEVVAAAGCFAQTCRNNENYYMIDY